MGTENGNARCGDKRKAPGSQKTDEDREGLQKKPWGTTGPPPPEWIEVLGLGMF